MYKRQVQNVTRFAEGKNCEVKSEKISDNEFKIEIMAENYTPADEEEEIVCAPSAKDDFIIAVSSNEMGPVSYTHLCIIDE